jgi:SAM-dependent methyltransferase
VIKTWSFDSELTQNYTRVRQTFISEFLDAINGQISLETAIDVGCGVGYFSRFLSERRLRVIAVDVREENANEGRRRHPEVTFLTRDIEDPTLPSIGKFDLVLCVGLIYHLENPFRAIRNLHALTDKVLIVESMCASGKEPIMKLVDEDPVDDQGLNYIAFYPTESCLVKMLYRAGFPFVYSFQDLPDDPVFHTSLWRRKQRTMLVASIQALQVKGLDAQSDVRVSWEILDTPRERLRSRLDRAVGLLHKFGRRTISPNSKPERR